eukprot:gb/GECH01011089.1/.p1 GENE.gb/GECH01011089.1/~~gb/GECH01011089.1/.p1  ORF type:complete len:140 (+),score=36.49 gb/GECH01011089.1/:1-420(+)
MSARGFVYFVMVGKEDNPVFEINLSRTETKKDEVAHLKQFIVHASLDLLEQQQWRNPHMYLKRIDSFQDLVVSAYVSPSNMRFLILHDGRSEDNLKSFFQEVNELYIKVLLNPFYELNTYINVGGFDQKVKALAQRHLG